MRLNEERLQAVMLGAFFVGRIFLRLSKKTPNNRNISIISLLIVEILLSLHCQTTK